MSDALEDRWRFGVLNVTDDASRAGVRPCAYANRLHKDPTLNSAN